MQECEDVNGIDDEFLCCLDVDEWNAKSSGLECDDGPVDGREDLQRAAGAAMDELRDGSCTHTQQLQHIQHMQQIQQIQQQEQMRRAATCDVPDAPDACMAISGERPTEDVHANYAPVSPLATHTHDPLNYAPYVPFWQPSKPSPCEVQIHIISFILFILFHTLFCFPCHVKFHSRGGFLWSSYLS